MDPLTDSQIGHFQRHGFFLMPCPFSGALAEIDRLQQEIEPVWKKTEWPKGFNRLACQFLMIGEPLLKLVDSPELVEMARVLLDCEQIHIEACGLGDASLADTNASKRPRPQVQWHADGRPGDKLVSVRTALDRHDLPNAPLRVLPGSHLRPRDEVLEEFMQLELATGEHSEMPELCYGRHPHEVEVQLDPRWSLVWTPTLWHATGEKKTNGLRRAMGWNYGPPGGRIRDVEAVKHIFHGQWESWTDERKRLWALI